MFLQITCLAALSGVSFAAQAVYQQCGGENWTGGTTCTPGNTCTYENAYYYQCLPDTQSSAAVTTSAQSAYGQCGGTGGGSPNSPRVCTSGFYCSTVNQYYFQCVPATTTSATSASTKPPTTLVTSTSSSKPVSSPVSKTSSTTTAAQPTQTGGKTKYAGVNISGFDFGCSTDGTCEVGSVDPPLPASGGADGPGQMKHFAQDDNLNAFRLPVGWQYLVNNNLGGTLNAANLGTYDQLVQACLSTGALCIIDIHNYARWDGGIIGQGGPTNGQFVSLWTQLATKYAGSSKVAFGVMNEPHDVNIQTWAATVQLVVTAIRNAGATSQYILLPGTDYSSATQFVADSATALLPIRNPDSSYTNLVFDVHQYLDSDFSGTNAECTTNQVNAFTTLAAFLRSNGRQAFLSETGGGNTQSCVTDVCQLLQYVNANADVFLGYTGWAAGSFGTGYVLSETPTLSGSTWTDTLLVSSCIKR